MVPGSRSAALRLIDADLRSRYSARRQASHVEIAVGRLSHPRLPDGTPTAACEAYRLRSVDLSGHGLVDADLVADPLPGCNENLLEETARVFLALLCTECPRRPVEYDGNVGFVGAVNNVTERIPPAGIICQRVNDRPPVVGDLDRRPILARRDVRDLPRSAVSRPERPARLQDGNGRALLEDGRRVAENGRGRHKAREHGSTGEFKQKSLFSVSRSPVLCVSRPFSRSPPFYSCFPFAMVSAACRRSALHHASVSCRCA